MNVPIVWIMGGPGSGKSTLSQNIVQKYGYKHVDPNELVEKEIQNKTEKGKQFAAKRDAGEQVAMSDIVKLLEKEILSNKGGLQGFIIDGYPQNQSDAKILEQSIGPPDLIIALQVGPETQQTRNSGKSGALPTTASAYIRNTKPVFDQYADKTMQIDGERDAQAVFDEVVPNMDTLVKNRGTKITIQR